MNVKTVSVLLTTCMMSFLSEARADETYVLYPGDSREHTVLAGASVTGLSVDWCTCELRTEDGVKIAPAHENTCTYDLPRLDTYVLTVMNKTVMPMMYELRAR
jgi:hypothetical protein